MVWTNNDNICGNTKFWNSSTEFCWWKPNYFICPIMLMCLLIPKFACLSVTVDFVFVDACCRLFSSECLLCVCFGCFHVNPKIECTSAGGCLKGTWFEFNTDHQQCKHLSENSPVHRRVRSRALELRVQSFRILKQLRPFYQRTP